MKVRTDFVTNSSSTSFCLYVQSTYAEKVEDFIKDWERIISICEKNKPKLPNVETQSKLSKLKDGTKPKQEISLVSGKLFKVSDGIVMYNDEVDDIPYYVKFLCLEMARKRLMIYNISDIYLDIGDPE